MITFAAKMDAPADNQAVAPVNDNISFSELIQLVRQGDEVAAYELVQRYEQEIRREVRIRLTDPAMRRIVDSMDICQSVLSNFFARAANGQFELDEPAQLIRLLITMARNKVIQVARNQTTLKRDKRREQSLDVSLLNQDNARSPSQIVSERDIVEQFRQRLSDSDRRIAELRVEGSSWTEIAEKLGGTAEALRKRFRRACDEIADEMNLSDF